MLLPASSSHQDCEKDAFVKAFGNRALREPFNRMAALYLKGFVRDLPPEHKLALWKLLKESQGNSELEISYRKGASSDSMGRCSPSGSVRPDKSILTPIFSRVGNSMLATYP
mmetsp:Transcript_39702/g.92967  ORF Transcript_39702/g.92967 Transcript_39702/m.92967 type:complete len:112 (+) Transcript_39702:197-532(+)